MELFNKVSAFAKSAVKDLTGATKSLGDAANDTIETAKLNAKLIPEKKGLDAQLKKLGEYYYEKHKNGEELEEGVAEFCAGADAYQKRIEELEKLIAEIEEAKKLREEQKVVAEAEAKVVESEEEAEAQTEETEKTEEDSVICPECGAANEAEMNFCCQCGAKLEKEEKEEGPKFCPNCGKEIPEGTKFCGECGTKVE